MSVHCTVVRVATAGTVFAESRSSLDTDSVHSFKLLMKYIFEKNKFANDKKKNLCFIT